MDKVTLSDISPQSETTASLLSLKRQKTDCTMINNHCGKSKFDFPKPLTFQESISSTSSTSILLKNEGLISTGECSNFQAIKPEDDYNAGLSERQLLLRGQDEQHPATETDKHSSYLGDVTCGSLAESPSSAGSDTPSHPDGKQLGKSLEDGTPGGCSLSAGKEEEEKKENDSSPIQAVTFSSRNEEIRYQSDHTDKYAGLDTGDCNTLSQFAEVVETNQKLKFNETILPFSKEETLMSASDNTYSKPMKDPSGNFAEGASKLELQFCENENVSLCDGETKGQVKEDGMSTTVMPSAVGCDDGSTLTYDVILDRKSAVESLEVDDLCGAKAQHAAGKIITKACNEAADHTTETPMPAGISQGLVDRDNGAGPFSVIDPAIWSETDRETEEKRCTTERTAGVELSPPVKVCEWETPLTLCSDVTPPQHVSYPDQFNHQNRTKPCQDENRDLCQSYIGSQAFSVIANGTHDKPGSEGPRRSPAKPPPAGDDGLQASCDTVAHQLQEQRQSSCFSVSSDHLKTQEAEYSQCEMARMDKRAEITETGNYEEARKSERKPQKEQQGDDTTETSTGEFISEWRLDRTLSFIEGEPANMPECLPDFLFSADISMMDVTPDKKGERQETNVREEIKTDVPENSERLDDVQLHNECMFDVTVLCGEHTSEWTEGTTFSLCSGDQEEYKLSCFPDDQLSTEISIAKNKPDLLAYGLSSASDAVVPYQHDLSHSHNAHINPTALNCCDKFSLLPSAIPSYNRLLGGFDTFEKIQLSPDDDDAAGLADIPVLTSLPAQLLKTPGQQLHHSMSESDKEMPAEEEMEEEEAEEVVERFESHTENMGNEFAFEVPNFISATDVIALSEQELISESACYSSVHIPTELNPQSAPSTVSTESDSSTSDFNHNSEFEMKKQFDVVLKELNMFFDISRHDFGSDVASRPPSPEQRKDRSEASECKASKCLEQLSSPEVELSRGTSSDDADEDRSLEMCKGDPVGSRTDLRGDGEQEVPLLKCMCQEPSMDTAKKHGEPQETEQKGKMWSPSFMCLPPLELLSHRPPEQPRRLEPLKTCARPIRVGLSKRAKTKRLHCPHPYK